MSNWNSHKPGASPVCIVGAGFPLAVLKPAPPSTGDLIEKTVRAWPEGFPILTRLMDGPLADFSSSRRLDSVWARIDELSRQLADYSSDIESAYADFPRRSRLVRMANVLKQWDRPINAVRLLLEHELKRMLAFQYHRSKLRLRPDGQLAGLNSFLEGLTSARTVWISLNYDTALEMTLNKVAWRYCFEDWFQAMTPPSDAGHLIAKPHGSLNIWFHSLWRCPSGDRHFLEFANHADRLDTCSEEGIGLSENKGDERANDYRPWLIPFVHDDMKGEMNSPGRYADAAHDMCKANLGFAALSLQRASSIYVLGYSMPFEDEWTRTRLQSAADRKIPIYVASGDDTQAIIRNLRCLGFSGATELTRDGHVEDTEVGSAPSAATERSPGRSEA